MRWTTEQIRKEIRKKWPTKNEKKQDGGVHSGMCDAQSGQGPDGVGQGDRAGAPDHIAGGTS